MRYLIALHSTPEAEKIAQKAYLNFKKKFNSISLEKKFKSGYVLTTDNTSEKNRGFSVVDDVVHLLPYASFATIPVDKYSLFFDSKTEIDVLSPFCYITVSNNKIQIAQDVFGYAKVFIYEQNGLVLITNSLSPSAKATNSKLNSDAIISIACLGFVGGVDTILEGYHLPPADGRITYTIQEQTIKKDLRSAPRVLPPEYNLEHLSDTLLNFAKLVVESSPSPLAMGLTGGRDSRLSTALFHKAGADLEMYTRDCYHDETDVVTRLVSLMPENNHTYAINSWTPSSPSKTDIFASAKELVRHHDGMYEPNYIGITRLNAADPLEKFGSNISISGMGGEALKGHGYPGWTKCANAEQTLKAFDLDALKALDRDAAFQYLFRRATAYANFASDDALARFKELFEINIGCAPSYWKDYKLIDYYILWDLPRWSNLATTPNVTSLFTCSTFSHACLSLTPEQKVTNSVLEDLTVKYLPEWDGEEYFDQSLAATPKNFLKTPKATDVEGPKKAYDLLTSHDELCKILKKDVLGRSLLNWDQNPNNVLLKRALWLFYIFEEFQF
jgi:hypothetical protein